MKLLLLLLLSISCHADIKVRLEVPGIMRLIEDTETGESRWQRWSKTKQAWEDEPKVETESKESK